MASSAEEMFKNILSDPDAMSKISGMLSSFTGGEAEQAPKKDDMGGLFDDPEMLLKISQTLGNLSGPDDPSVNLITALKPYLSGKRAESAEQAIKFLKLSKLSALFGDFNLF